jgi:excisionase family DNA binding protein
MQDATAGSQDAPVAGYSLHEAAAVLGVGVNTLRRRIAAGRIRAEQVQRPQGYVWRVYLDDRHPPTQPADDPPIQEATGSLPHPPAVPAQAEAMVSLIQTTIGTVLGPLVGQLDAQRQTIERQAGELREMEREAGRLMAELAAERAKSPLVARREAHFAEPTQEPFAVRWRRWAWAAVLISAILAVVILLLFVLPPLDGAL